MKRNFKKWVLLNEKGNVVIEGRHNKVVKELYHRYVYQHIFTDTLYRTNENI